ncbi:MAG: hypothetical protein JXA50_01755 [Deltaproteobacteria bacterium]|nr:hypothetical protein [Deltaproteobacteria bacterium]
MSEKMIHKTFRGEIRGVDEKSHTVTALVSGEKVDRYNEVILAAAWSKGLGNFKAHNVLVSSHRYSDLRAQIGEVPSTKGADDGLEAKLKYYTGEGNPEADWAWQLALKGKAAYSVGFISRKAKRKGDDGYDELIEELRARGSIGKKDQPWAIYTEVELLEISHVLVPAYPDALQKAMFDDDPVMAEVAKEVCEDGELECVMEAVQKMFDDLEAKAKYTCECIKCGHQIETDRHCKDLKCPKCGGQMRRAEKPGPGQDSIEGEDEEVYGGEKSGPGEAEEKKVIPYKEAPKADEGDKWDGPKEVAAADVADLKVMCTWYDDEKPDIKGSYKLPHQRQKDKYVVWNGVKAAMAALLGARGGVKIPDDDRKAVYDHLAKHYKQFDKTPPEFKDYTEDELRELFPEVYEEKIQGELEETEGVNDTLDEIKQQLTILGESVKKMGDALAEFLAKQADANVSQGKEVEQDDYLKTILEKVEEANEGLRKTE